MWGSWLHFRYQQTVLSALLIIIPNKVWNTYINVDNYIVTFIKYNVDYPQIEHFIADLNELFLWCIKQ